MRFLKNGLRHSTFQGSFMWQIVFSCAIVSVKNIKMLIFLAIHLSKQTKLQTDINIFMHQFHTIRILRARCKCPRAQE